MHLGANMNSCFNPFSKVPFSLAFALAVSSSGCAVTSIPAMLVTTEKANVLLCERKAISTSLGVLPIADLRPIEERDGTKPKGLYFLLWNQRMGDYVTSDQDFIDMSEFAMTRRIKMDLAQTYCFSSVTMISKSPSLSVVSHTFLRSIAVQQKLDYILSVELKHLYGKQRQDAYVYIVPAIVFNTFGHDNEVKPATGYTELRFILYDGRTGQRIWQGDVRGRQTVVEDGAYPQAAAESFATASQNLANQFYRFVQLKGNI